MTTDQKIDEVLAILRQHDRRFDELFHIVAEEHQLNNNRFTQLAMGLQSLEKKVHGMDVSLNSKIDRVHESLAADINAFGADLYETKRRVTRLEKKMLS